MNKDPENIKDTNSANTYTSAEANKLLKKLNDELNALNRKEIISSTYVEATTEEHNPPAYNFRDMQNKTLELEKKIAAVKHAINVFNTTHVVPGFDRTIDEMLVYIPQLTARKEKFERMMNVLPKTRLSSSSSLIEYRYTNYDIEDAAVEYNAVSNTLAKAQLALDQINSTEVLEINI